MFLALAVLGVRIAWDEYTFGETSPGIGVPSWWYSVWLPVFSVAIALRALALALRNARALKALKQGEERAQ
jgi:TRAP-type C4-dicarboxylate transport system permease small subunit